MTHMDWAVPPHFADGGAVLCGLILAPEAERAVRPDDRAHIDIEIHGQDPQGRSEAALATTDALLKSIDELKAAAEDLAPGRWRLEYLERPDYSGLFLDGLEFHDSGTVRALFDFGDLDLLILELHPDGRRIASVES
ncbi:hypothetical protein ABFU82_17670 [Nocardioides sp. WV_118_6]